jgi:hypothetical protein
MCMNIKLVNNGGGRSDVLHDYVSNLEVLDVNYVCIVVKLIDTL